jgi:hypothetical protein
MDKFGLLPASIRQNYEREEMVDRQMQAAHSLYRSLQALDHRLDLVFISDRADPEYGVVPGRWHVTRKNDGAPDSYIPIVGRKGEYVEPHSGIVVELQERDMWKHGIPKNDAKPSAFREPKGMDEGQIEELAHDIRAGSRLPGDGGLTKRLWGKGKMKGVVGT